MKKGKNPSKFLKKILQRYKNRILIIKRIILLSKNVISCMQSQESNINQRDIAGKYKDLLNGVILEK